MATTVIVPGLDSVPEVELHHLPCLINQNGAAEVRSYFKPVKETGCNGKEQISATFRGRPLDGEEIRVPEGYVGMVVREKRRPFTEDEDRTIDVEGKFETFTEWHLDSKFTSSSTVRNAVDVWTKIAEAVHSPVDIKEDIKKEPDS